MWYVQYVQTHLLFNLVLMVIPLMFPSIWAIFISDNIAVFTMYIVLKIIYIRLLSIKSMNWHFSTLKYLLMSSSFSIIFSCFNVFQLILPWWRISVLKVSLLALWNFGCTPRTLLLVSLISNSWSVTTIMHLHLKSFSIHLHSAYISKLP